MTRAAPRLPAIPWPGRFDPFQRLFRLLTSVRFAIGLIATLVVLSVAGVVIPQVPEEIRRTPALRDAWLQDQHDRYGPIASVLEWLGAFQLFTTAWFTALLAVLVLAIAVCTWGRLPPTWRQVRRIPPPVNDRFFETARHRSATGAPASPGALEQSLRDRRFRLWRVEDGERRYVYADRNRWSPLATFVSHLGLVMLLAGAVVTWRMGDREDLLIAEGTSAPVFALDSDDHMQVKVTDFVRTLDDQGRELDLYSELQVFRAGELVASGRSTINDPLTYDGFRFHQIAFAENGVALDVRERGGPAVYSEVVQLGGVLPVPRLLVEDAHGRTVFEGLLPSTFFLAAGAGGAPLELEPGAAPHTVALRELPRAEAEGGPPLELIVAGPDGGIGEAALGEVAVVDGFRFTFEGLTAAQVAVVEGLPGAPETGTLLQLINAGDGDARLVVVEHSGVATWLNAGEPAPVGDMEYVFRGTRDFSGIMVRRDPGAGFIWVAAGMLLGGVTVTFWFPRRRLWARITGDRVELAGIAPRNSGFTRELDAIASEASGPQRDVNGAS